MGSVIHDNALYYQGYVRSHNSNWTGHDPVALGLFEAMKANIERTRNLSRIYL